MPEIRIILSSALAEKQRIATESNNRILVIAAQQLNDEFELIPADVTKERISKIIQLKRHGEEQQFCQLVDSDEELLSELPSSKDTILAELAQIIRQLQ